MKGKTHYAEDPTKLKLSFMVDPDQLKEKAYVPNAIKIKLLSPNNVHLGESGKRMAAEGFHFYVEKNLALALIDIGEAEEV